MTLHLRFPRCLELAQKRIARAHQLNSRRIDVDHPWCVDAAADAKRLAPRIVSDRSTVVLDAVADTRAVHGDDITLILDRARARQHVPVGTPTFRPVRDEENRVDVGRHGAKELGKAQIEADKETEARTLDRDDNRSIPGRVHLVLARIGEEPLFAIQGGNASHGIEQHRRVHQSRRGFFAHRESGEHPYVMFTRRRSERATRAVLRRQRLGPTRAFHGEPRRAHLGEHDESRAQPRRTRDHIMRATDRCLGIVPAGVVLTECRAQRHHSGCTGFDRGEFRHRNSSWRGRLHQCYKLGREDSNLQLPD